MFDDPNVVCLPHSQFIYTSISNRTVCNWMRQKLNSSATHLPVCLSVVSLHPHGIVISIHSKSPKDMQRCPETKTVNILSHCSAFLNIL